MGKSRMQRSSTNEHKGAGCEEVKSTHHRPHRHTRVVVQTEAVLARVVVMVQPQRGQHQRRRWPRTACFILQDVVCGVHSKRPAPTALGGGGEGGDNTVSRGSAQTRDGRLPTSGSRHRKRTHTGTYAAADDSRVWNVCLLWTRRTRGARVRAKGPLVPGFDSSTTTSSSPTSSNTASGNSSPTLTYASYCAYKRNHPQHTMGTTDVSGRHSSQRKAAAAD